MDLDSKIWQTLKGGYKIPYDASLALRKLDSENKDQINISLKDLWGNLHHQGDVGLASYYAVPELINICIKKRSVDYDFIGLVLLIENSRQLEHNPKLPVDIHEEYFNSLMKLEEYLLINFKRIKDRNALQATLGLFAAMNGLPELGRLIEKLDDDLITELLEGF